MKAVCEGIDLSDAVLKVVKACASKTTVPVLECIKISAVNDTLTLSATDGEISIQKNIKAEIYEEGDVCVPLDSLKPVIPSATRYNVNPSLSKHGATHS